MTETVVNPMQQVLDVNRTMFVATAEQANALAAQYKAQGNTDETVADLIETSDHENVVKFRQFRDDLSEKILAAQTAVEGWVRDNLLPKADDAKSPEELKAEWTVLRDQLKAVTAVLKQFGGEDAVKDLPEVMSIGRSGKAGSQSGVRRPRVSRILLANAKDAENKTEVYTEKKNDDGTTDRVVRMSTLAQKLGVEPSKLIEAADTAAGTKDWASLSGKPFEFAYATESDNWIITVTPTDPSAAE